MKATTARLAGILLPAFSPRREGDLGIGDTKALEQWLHWAADQNIGFLQLLPINETGSDDSPYNAISSVALDPVYLTMDPTLIPGLEESDVAEAQEFLGDDVLQARLVDYAKVGECKRALLETAYGRFIHGDYKAEKNDLRVFQQQEAAWLNDYSLFRWLMDQADGREQWDHWPKAFNTPSLAREYFHEQRKKRGDQVVREQTYYSWVQWLCFRQWRAVRALADKLGVKLMGDVPIGISYHSADVFFLPDQFNLEWFGGAPAETMFKHDRFIQRWGQNWGVPVYRWDAMEKDGYVWWKQRVRKLTEIFQIFRIDHILGFYRIYAFPWRPERNAQMMDLTPEEAKQLTGGRLPQWAWRDDHTQENRAANRDDGDRRLRAILAAAGDAEIVGEDLGCVPEYVRPHLESLGIAGFRIPHWDSDQGHVVDGSRYPECSFATYATHDHDTLAALWESFRLNAVGNTCTADEQTGGQWNIRMMAEFANMEVDVENPPVYDSEVQWKLLEALLACRSRYAALMITDLFGMFDRYNKPGTVDAENWSLRLPFTLEEMQADASRQKDIRHLRKLIQRHRDV
jgi:4-alpha-glucanotransferase